MTENEQIEEITKVLCADYDNCEDCPFAVNFADYSTCDKKELAGRIVLEKDYRKASEVAREIFEDIEKLKHTKWDWSDVVEWDALAELKKKYTEVTNNDEK